jgi:hypothetical protein
MTVIDTMPQRQPDGRFAAGNTLSKGHLWPMAPRVYALKEAILHAIEPEDLANLIRKVVRLCYETESLKELCDGLTLVLDRAVGKAVQPAVVTERHSSEGMAERRNPVRV